MLDVGFLVAVRRRAMRSRSWWRALDGLERGIYDLTIRLLDDVRSVSLQVQIVRILSKLRKSFRSGFVRHLEDHGVERLRQVCRSAEVIGCNFINSLRRDQDFLKYLVFLDYNQPIGWGIYPRE
jgi:hypothetical protein